MFPNSERNMTVNMCNICSQISKRLAEDMMALASRMKSLQTTKLPKRLHQTTTIYYCDKIPLCIVRSEVVLIFDVVAVINLCLSYFS